MSLLDFTIAIRSSAYEGASMNAHHDIRSMLTDHALVRAQQRGFRLEDMETVILHGRPFYDHQGARIWTISRKKLSKLKERLPGKEAAQLDHLADAYVVELLNGSIATVGHRYKRLPNRG